MVTGLPSGGFELYCIVLPFFPVRVRLLPSGLPSSDFNTHSLFELFWKNGSYVSGESVCVFVALWLFGSVCSDVCCRSQFSACTVTQWKRKMQTIQYRRTRIWEMKKDKYTKTLAKNQVCETFQMRDIGKNGLPKFIKLCMETPCWCPFQEHQYGRRIPTETSVFEFSY